MTQSTGRDSDKFMLRLPEGMRDRIKVAAEKNGRSMNAEIVVGLKMYLGITEGVETPHPSDDGVQNLIGLPEEEQLRAIVESHSRRLYSELKEQLRAPPADISEPPDFPQDDEPES